MIARFVAAGVLCLTMTAAVQAAESARIVPEGLPASPGEYSSYEDWLGKQHFTRTGMPDEVVNDYVQCAYRALYALTTASERDVLDRAATGNGMTATELRAFERAVADRFDDGEVTKRIVETCKGPYDRYLAAKPKD